MKSLGILSTKDGFEYALMDISNSEIVNTEHKKIACPPNLTDQNEKLSWIHDECKRLFSDPSLEFVGLRKPHKTPTLGRERIEIEGVIRAASHGRVHLAVFAKNQIDSALRREENLPKSRLADSLPKMGKERTERCRIALAAVK